MIRLFFAILVAKFAAFLTRVFRFGHASSLPGVLAEKIDPRLVSKLSAKFKRGVILITGTNGKTTTAKLISNILSAAGFTKIHNQTGANLIRGVASSLISHSSIFGRVNCDFGLFEIDEATIPEAVKKLNPKIILFNNLFRDQLDRYGEIDKIAKVWKKSLENISPNTKIILNVDDPSIAFLAQKIAKNQKNKYKIQNTECENNKCLDLLSIDNKSRHQKKQKNQDNIIEIITFGIEEEKYKLEELPHFADAIFCPKCGTKFKYKILYLSHLGKYFCPKCGLTRPEPQISAKNIELKGTDGIKLSINYGYPISIIFVNLFGLYNAYNILAAAAVAQSLDIPQDAIKKGLEIFTPAFGRFEKTKIDSTPVTLLLIKNPTGATEVIHSLAQDFSTSPRSARSITYSSSLSRTSIPLEEKKKNLFVILNDDIPDGRDVSWIWDTDWESMAPFVNFVFISGKRAEDMILRLKYADFNQDKLFLIKNDKEALFAACEKSASTPLYILPNYSAMLSLRNFLAERKYLPKIES